MPRFLPLTDITELTPTRPEGRYKAFICFCFSSPFSDCLEMTRFLHPGEQAYYNTLRLVKRKKNYLMGRYAAKRAAAAFLNEDSLERILVQRGIFDQPMLIYECNPNVQISLTHSNEIAAAVAFSEAHPMGIDIEKIEADKKNMIKNQMTEAERKLRKNMFYPDDIISTVLWTAKEALSKILKTGLTASFRVFEVSAMEIKTDCIISLFTNFPQYKAISFRVGHYMCSIVCAKKTEFDLDMKCLVEKLNRLSKTCVE